MDEQCLPFRRHHSGRAHKSILCTASSTGAARNGRRHHNGSERESRVPFADHRVVALALRMSFSEHLRWKHAFAPLQAVCAPIGIFSEALDVSKAALRSLYRDRLPSSVVRRKKLGFPLPLESGRQTKARSRFGA
ncbi:hypothetical protein IVB12_09465 [Bradyrhizobium sp. 179]|nr:hypothetical protein [Bradyrhizobium sp. 179]